MRGAGLYEEFAVDVAEGAIAGSQGQFLFSFLAVGK